VKVKGEGEQRKNSFAGRFAIALVGYGIIRDMLEDIDQNKSSSGRGSDGRAAGAGDKAESAKNLFLSGCNCSQSVFCAFASDYGIAPEVARKTACGLGGGIGRMREVCGAVSAAALVFGLECGDDKTLVYAKVQEFCARFKNEAGSIICRELLEGAKVPVETGGKPEERGERYYRKRPCAELVALAAGILEDMLKRG
jgi:C_GCAxxG_C_C family probable redox protein